jgi:hypothetical protein
MAPPPAISTPAPERWNGQVGEVGVTAHGLDKQMVPGGPDKELPEQDQMMTPLITGDVRERWGEYDPRNDLQSSLNGP